MTILLDSQSPNQNFKALPSLFVYDFGFRQKAPWFELGIKVMRKRPQRVGGTQNGKSGFDSSSYTEFYQEHDWHLIFDVWWPHTE